MRRAHLVRESRFAEMKAREGRREQEGMRKKAQLMHVLKDDILEAAVGVDCFEDLGCERSSGPSHV